VAWCGVVWCGVWRGVAWCGVWRGVVCGVAWFVWCGVIRDQLIGQYIFPKRLTGDIYANFLQDELPAHLENVPVQTRRQMYYQHDGAPPHFSPVVRQYLNHKFPNRWIGRGGTHNWPPWSPDLNQLYYQVWGYMKAMVYADKVNTQVELLQRILSAARSINNAAVFHKVTSFLWSRESENVYKQTEDTSNNLLER